jgi:hypothetical protein
MRLAASAMLAGTVCCVGSAHAQLPGAFRKACPEAKTVERWCAPQAVSEGWKLKYKNESPPNEMDGYSRYEVWVRDQVAVLCMFVGTRGGTRINYCSELSEASQ